MENNNFIQNEDEFEDTNNFFIGLRNGILMSLVLWAIIIWVVHLIFFT